MLSSQQTAKLLPFYNFLKPALKGDRPNREKETLMQVKKTRFAAVAGTCLACMLAFAGVAAVASGEEQKAANDGQAQEVIADAAFEYDQYGVIDASYWADKFPLEYNSYLMTAMDVPLEYGEALDYLRRENIPLPPGTPRGYVTVSHGGRRLGFMKSLGNRANNLYPQAWRIRNL